MSKFTRGSLVKVLTLPPERSTNGYFPTGKIGRVLNFEQSRADGHFNYAVKFFDGDSNIFTESQLYHPFNTPQVDCHGTLAGEFIDMRAPMVLHADKRLRVTSKGRLLCYWHHGECAVGGLYIVPAGYRGLWQVKQRGPHDHHNRYPSRYVFFDYLGLQKV
jgi:hypothetical protein